MTLLHFQTYGEKTTLPDLLILHGLFGSGRNWRSIALNLALNRQVHVVDIRNHGKSFWSDQHSYHDMANDLAYVIDTINSPLDIIGHSMGGKAAMTLALLYPEKIQKLCIIDIAPKKYNAEHLVHIDIMQALPLASITNRQKADTLLAEKIKDPSLRAFFLQNLEFNTTSPRWQLNLNALRINMPSIMNFPKISGQCANQTLFIRGGLSSYIQDADRKYIDIYFPNAIIKTIPNAGHWVHAHSPHAFLKLVKSFHALNNE